jgi:pimeloyl-ACP methyl ester carboxylesterase
MTETLSFAAGTSRRTHGTTGGPRVVLVHGSIVNATWMWGPQRPLAETFTLVTPNRSGYPPHAAREQIDFYEQADELAAMLDDDAHLVGYSYGGIVALLAAAQRPDAVRSLTVIEPPALWLARGNEDVDRLAFDLFKLFFSGPSEPRAFLEKFLPLLGASFRLPRQLPADLEQGARALMGERGPWDARIPLDELAAAAFPKLVVSGAHHPALEAVCDALERGLDAERAVIRGGGHNIPQLGERFNEVLSGFVERAESCALAA